MSTKETNWIFNIVQFEVNVLINFSKNLWPNIRIAQLVCGLCSVCGAVVTCRDMRAQRCGHSRVTADTTLFPASHHPQSLLHSLPGTRSPHTSHLIAL